MTHQDLITLPADYSEKKNRLDHGRGGGFEVDAASTMRWVKIDVLDDGHVALVDVMGDDSSVVDAARVSYGKGTHTTSDDRTLIRYLMRHRHTTPFEMAEVKFRVRVPMDCWRQWIRHRTANVNEYSTRYSEAIDSQQSTEPEMWRLQSKSNKQGSEEGSLVWPDEVQDGYGNPGQFLSAREAGFHARAREIYEERLRSGVAREQARKDLPLSTYTESYWKCDLHNIFHFLSLRLDSHAQQEIRAYAQAMWAFVKVLFPICAEAFEDYRLNGMFLTGVDLSAIQSILLPQMSFASEDDFNSEVTIENKREKAECLNKLKRLGLVK